MGDDLFTAAADPPVKAGSARTITADLMARLERHYIKPGEPFPGGVFLPEVGWNGSTNTRRCDAIYVGFTSTSGRLLVGHEVKASRSDWLHELDQVHKADAWADQCHEWWLVTVPGVVHDGELPAGWGLMHPGPSATRMKVVTKAQRHVDRQPSWDAMRSIMARQDTLRASAISNAKVKAGQDARADVEAEIERRVAAKSGDSQYELEYRARERAELEGYRRALGVTLVDRHDEYGHYATNVTADELADLATLLRASGGLAQALDSLLGRYGPFSSLRRHWDDLDKAMRDAAASTKTAKAGA